MKRTVLRLLSGSKLALVIMLAVGLTPVAGQTVPFGADLLRMDRGGILFGSAAVQECLEGDLVWIWGDRRAPVDRSTDYSLFLMTDGRVLVPLRIDDDVLRRAGGFLGLREKHVQVQGSWCQTEMLAKASHSEFEATAIALASEGSTSAIINKTAEHAIGERRWVSILVRFADTPSITPRQPEYVQGLMDGDAAPSIANYFREVSFGQLTLGDSAVVGWFTLPGPRSFYVYDRDANGSPDVDFDRLTRDTIALADSQVDFASFSNVNIMCNGNLNDYSYGGLYPVQADGLVKWVGMTWLADWGWENQSVVAHEIGHGLGLPHSSGPYAAVYDSRWDVMSNTWGNCEPADPVVGCVAAHTIAFHKDILGWIPPSKRFVAPAESTSFVDLVPTEQSSEDAAYQLAVVPVSLATQNFYTLEVRRRQGYDVRLPGEGVIIHRVDTTSAIPAQVVDATNDSDPNDDGAIWTVGEHFEDPLNNIAISVDAETASGFQVTIVRGGSDDAGCPAIEVPTNHWRGEYYVNAMGWGLPLAIEDRGAEELDFELQDDDPIFECGIPSGLFLSRWTKAVELRDGNYRLQVDASQGVRVRIDNRVLIDDLYFAGRVRELTIEAPFSQGVHVLEVESRVVLMGPRTLRVSMIRTANDFSVHAAPRTIIARPKDAFDIGVAISRYGSLSGPVTVRVSDASSAGLKLRSPAEVSTQATAARFRFKCKKNARPGTYQLTFNGRDSSGTLHTAVAYVTVTE